MELSRYDAVVIGGGFFGCKLSLYLKPYFKRILLLEKEADLLQRASYVNQARVHNGYHYPRSLLTALRSRTHFPRFVNEYRECIVSDFEKYYAIGKIFSKVNAKQFKNFCERIDAPIETAPVAIKKLFNKHLIEEVFFTKEYAFDATKLKERIYSELEKTQIKIRVSTEVIKLAKRADSSEIEVICQSPSNHDHITTRYVFNCTYSALNTVLKASHLPTIPLKHEFVEMALVEVPNPMKYLGITVMCGPFFSIMPFPSQNLHTLSHVRYTPHCYWQDSENFASPTHEIYHQAARQSNYFHMLRDATRYLPILKDCRYVDSIWEVKTVLPQSETDDSRPILFQKNSAWSNLISVLGGKIDNVYDIPGELDYLQLEINIKTN